MDTVNFETAEEHWIEIDGLKIHYREAGEGKCLVLIHAAGHSLEDFNSIFDKLKTSYRVIAIDLPGHGKSDLFDPPTFANVITLSKYIQEFSKQVVKEKAIYLGNSIGGFLSISLALASPELVKGLVLVNSGGFNEPGLIADNFTRLKGKEWITRIVWNTFPSLYIKVKNEFTKDILSRIRNNKTDNAIKTNASIWRSFLLPEHNLRERAKEIECPTFLIWGKRDPVIELKIGIQATQLIPDARLELLNTGHLPFAEDPENFFTVLKSFLETIE
ncbi:MAG TPA: alpha/beta hydrolase [Leptospiraceae bacterium]|nr:alpha/beta hydrolase [Leptospiraceae bacterium]HMW05997.1 alpha/beta hydrolase [Leptospiraceae bacterium]HMX32071.1 alpha/beta hydrolase [Leptospiraceae bacterium]HMY32351.1 alpha/beta hydrolase [Leptospiraceae bacterium]HMZ62447.1 alpha/beta hydrolase [Leptospiraceae bacterium]